MRISLDIPSDLRYVPKRFLKEWAHKGFIERKSCIDIWQAVQETVNDESRVGLYLAGPMGVGRSSIMFYVVNKARQNSWFVIYIPRCDNWLQFGRTFSAGWFAYLFDAVSAGLQYVKNDEIKKKYEYCCPPNNYQSWESAFIDDDTISLELFERMFTRFRRDILFESDIEVLLAFDDSHALFDRKNVDPLFDHLFSFMDWSEHLKRGCIFLTAGPDSPFRRKLRPGHETFIRYVGALSDDEVKEWFQSDLFSKIVKHPDYNDDLIPEIRRVTGDIPGELVMLDNLFGRCRGTSLNQILKCYSRYRLTFYLQRFRWFAEENPDDVETLFKNLSKLIKDIEVCRSDISIEFFDTGLVYCRESSVVPLNSNALKCFCKLLFE